MIDANYFMNKEKIVVVAGPTGVGKSSYGIKLAKKYNGEIISADSVQIYKGLDIGSGKVTESEMEGVPHHMLSIITPKEEFTVMDFVSRTRVLITEIIQRGKLPIIVGGTGFYINALLHGYKCGSCPPDKKLRGRLGLLEEQRGKSYLCDNLLIFNYRCASVMGDEYRIKKELEHMMNPEYDEGTGVDYADCYDAVLIVMDADRKTLDEYAAIRIRKMLDAGLLDEIRGLKEYWSCRALKTVGYKEFLEHIIDNDVTLESAFLTARKNYHALIKKQQTYFRWMRWDNMIVSRNGDKKGIQSAIKKLLKERDSGNN